MRYVSLFLLAVVLYSCAPRAEKKPMSPSDFVRLERTPCFGSCPVYIVTIFGDGRIAFEGHQYVTVTGTVSGHTAIDSVSLLFEQAEKIHFFDLQDSYESKKINDSLTEMVTDLPGRRITVSSVGNTKTVYDYYGGPPELQAFADAIDRIANTKRWVGR